MKILKNHSLSDQNTFNVDVTAKYFCETQSLEDLQSLLQSREFRTEQHLILGGGSNILFTKDFEGIVIKISQDRVTILSEENDFVIVEVEAGYDWDSFVNYAISKGWYGLENLSLIPGKVGASPIQNIGAYGAEVSNYIQSVQGIDLNNSNYRSIPKSECDFNYRDSIFKNKLKNEFIVTSVVYKLSKKEKPNLNYTALKNYFEENKIDDTSAESIRNAVIQIRESKLPDPKYLGNAGSYFKNPIIAKQVYNEIKSNHEDLQGYSISNDLVKISAGWLIEKSNLKGIRVDNVGVFENQALVIVNHGKATGSDIKKFAEDIMEKVKQNFGINLIPEVNIL